MTFPHRHSRIPCLRIRTTALATLLGLVCAVTCVFLPVAAAQTSSDADLVGRWQGALAVGDVELPLDFELRQSADGTLTGTLDSPAQGATGIPIETVTVEADSLRLDIRALGATYAGRLNATRDTVEGEWRQSGRVFPLSIKKAEEEPDSMLSKP